MISLRLAIAVTTPMACDFIMIDEGFGCMDDVNISRLTDLFTLISEDYRFVFIISHKTELQNIIDHPLCITTVIDAALGASCSHVANTLEGPSSHSSYPQHITSTPSSTHQSTTSPSSHSSPQSTFTSTPISSFHTNKLPITVVNGKKKITCECGAVIGQGQLKDHLKRETHKKRLIALGRVAAPS